MSAGATRPTMMIDLTSGIRAANLLAGEKALLEMVATGQPLGVTLEALCTLVEETTEECLCSVLLVDGRGRHVEDGAGPSLPTSFRAAIHGRLMNVETGPCAMAACIGEQVLSPDIASDTRWDAYGWRELALAHGLRACWSTPIFSSEARAIGTFALYLREPGAPTEAHQRIIERMTHIAAVAIERRRTLEALTESEERLRLIADAIPEVIWLASLEPEQVLYVSPSFEAVWGLPVEALYRNPRVRTDPIHPDDRARFEEAVSRGLASDMSYEVEYRIARRPDDIRWIQERGTRIRDRAGWTSRISGISTDITERKQAEDRLRRSESDLAHVTRVATLGEMTASIAHEINQPLTAIEMNLTAALRRLDREEPELEVAAEDLRRGLREVHRAANVIARLRALFHKSDPVMVSFDLNEAIEEVLMLTDGEMRRRHVKRSFDRASALPDALGDRVQIQQVVLNLILNGVEAMSAIGEHDRRLDVRSQAAGEGWVEIAVRDAGPGIDPAQADLIFEPFFTTRAGGMGIGLSISRSIVERHGGRLRADHNEEGMTFSFTIPTVPESG